MNGRGVPTGALPAVREALGLMTYPPTTASVRAARRFAEAAVGASDEPGLADDAGLLVSELAANAVLHARTNFDVAVYAITGGVRISVRDHSAALPVLVAPSATAMSGRGLALVQTLAAQWGAGHSTSEADIGGGAAKSVWFELVASTAAGEGAAGPGSGSVAGGPGDEPVEGLGVADLSVEELLAAWGEAEVDAVEIPYGGSDHAKEPVQTGGVTSDGEAVSLPSPQPGDQSSVQPSSQSHLQPGVQEVLQVQLAALDAAELLAAKEQMDDVLRELQLLLLSDGAALTTPTEADLGVARALDAAARDFDDVRRQVRAQVSLAVATGQRLVVLRLDLTSGTARRAAAYLDAVEAVEDLAQAGALLSVGDSLRAHHRVRRAYLEEAVAAARQR